MISAVIIEDERIIAEELRKMLQGTSQEIEVISLLPTVKEAVEYFNSNKAPDLIFSDVQLPDGLSFDIFSQVDIKSPVVFITAYDKFIINAFEHNGIDYLMKPVDERDLEKAVSRYKTLEKHFTAQHPVLAAFRQRNKSRLIVRKGIENIALKTEDIVLIYTENKLVLVVDKEGKKYILDRNLAELETELDTTVFFRVNRQYIVNIGFVKSYKTYEKVKLQVDLTMPDLSHHHIVVSQQMAPFFRKWISEL